MSAEKDLVGVLSSAIVVRTGKNPIFVRATRETFKNGSERKDLLPPYSKASGNEHTAPKSAEEVKPLLAKSVIWAPALIAH